MTAYSSKCSECQRHCDWIKSPTGGWWAHREQSHDFHQPRIYWQPMQHQDQHGNWMTM